MKKDFTMFDLNNNVNQSSIHKMHEEKGIFEGFLFLGLFIFH